MSNLQSEGVEGFCDKAWLQFVNYRRFFTVRIWSALSCVGIGLLETIDTLKHSKVPNYGIHQSLRNIA